MNINYRPAFTDNPITELVEGLSFIDYQQRSGTNNSSLGRFDIDGGGCPEAYYYATTHPELKEEISDSQVLGYQAHTNTLEPDTFAERFVVLDSDTQERLYAEALALKSKAKGFSRALSTYKSWESEQAAAGKCVVMPERYQQLQDMREALLKRTEITEEGVFDDSRYEVSLFAGFETPAGSLQLKGRPDIMPANNDAIFDYKTARSAHPRMFAKAVAEYGYAGQAAMYLDLARGNGLEKKRFGFVTQETTAPYLAAIHWLDEDWLRYARIRYRKILLDIGDCVKRNSWPGYESGVLMPPSYLQNEIEAMAA